MAQAVCCQACRGPFMHEHAGLQLERCAASGHPDAPSANMVIPISDLAGECPADLADIVSRLPDLPLLPSLIEEHFETSMDSLQTFSVKRRSGQVGLGASACLHPSTCFMMAGYTSHVL